MEGRSAGPSARRSWTPAVVAAAVAMLAGVASAGATPPVKAGTPRGVIRHRKGSALVGRMPPVDTPLQYFGGPVLRTNETFAIFWDPAGQLSQDYRDLVVRYLQDVAADSGQTTNVYSVLDQYYDTTGPIAYQSTFVGSMIDTNPFPRGCPVSPEFPECFNDAQLAQEIDGFLFAHGVARPSNRAFMVFTPPGVDVCFDSSGFGCRSTYFCAYHSGFTGGHGDAIYAIMPFAADPFCDIGEHPNGNDADPVLNALSHEHREMINDPLVGSAFSLGPPLAWFDPFSFAAEGSDKCAYYFGPTRNNGVGAFNQVINGHEYLLQAEWSNALAEDDGLGCVLDGADRAPTAAFTSAVHGAVATFDGGASSDPDPVDSIDVFFWDFDDGTRAFGPTPLHRFAAAGTYHVTLTVTDSRGAASSTRQDVVIEHPVLSSGFSAHLDESLDDRGSAFGSGNAARLGSVHAQGIFINFDFSNFPLSVDVFEFMALVNNSGDTAFVSTQLTLTDTASPPQGNDYALTGTYSMQGGTGLFAKATGTGTISGSCTSSFTSDVAQCSERWKGTFGQE
jgi:PKD repeat protein